MKTGNVEGYLEVGVNESGEVVVNHPDLRPDEKGVGHIVFSPRQARNFAKLLNQKAADAEHDEIQKLQALTFARNAETPVDRTARTLADGSPITEGHREMNPLTGQQKGYIVLSAEERAKGFVRPVRMAYIHIGINPKMHGPVLIKAGDSGCGMRTVMAQSIAETYARDPGFYSGTFCVGCHEHRPLNEFVWEGTTEQVGS